MKLVREYEIWSTPGSPTVDPASTVAQVAKELGFAGEVIIPFNQVPEPVDCQNLNMAMAERELSIEDLADFCSSTGYSLNLDDPNLAYHFLNYSFGQRLAWVHLDAKDDHDAVRARIFSVARRNELALVDPEDLACVFFPG